MDSDPGVSNSSSSTNPLEGWTADDKYFLFLALKCHGSKKIKEIVKQMGNRTEAQVYAAIKYYKNKAIETKNTKKVSKRVVIRKTKMQSTVPLANWANYLTDTLNYEDLGTETTNALRLIAEFDNIPPPVQTEQVNFRHVYRVLADAMEGKAVPNDRVMTEVINICALETAIISKSYIKPSVFSFVVNSLKVNTKDTINYVPRPTGDPELVTIRHLASQRNYNPMNIPEEFLKSSSTLHESSTPNV